MNHVSCGLFAVLAVAPALGQDVASPSEAQNRSISYGLEEVIVVAQKRAEAIQDVPIAVTSVSSDVMLSFGLESPAALQRVSPGLMINTSGAISSPYIRGVGTQYATLGLESSVATYFNGVYVSRPSAGLLSFNDIDHVEVLKGAQGTLYGRNSSAGAINVITRDPVNYFEGNAAIVAGDFNLRGAEGVLNVPASDSLALRFTGRYRERDAYMRRAYADQPEIGGTEEYQLGAKALWTPSERLTAKLSLDYSDLTESDLVAYTNIADSTPEMAGIVAGGRGRTGFHTVSNSSDLVAGFRNRPPREWADSTGVQLRIDYDFGFATLSSITGWRNSYGLAYADYDATDAPLQIQKFNEESDVYSQEFQLSSTGSGPLKWIVGTYFFKEDGANTFELWGTAINDLFGVPYSPTVGFREGNPILNLSARVEAESWAPYAQASWEFAEKFEITAGLRYTSEKKKLLHNVVSGLNVISEPLELLREEDVEYDFTKLTPKLTFSYKPNDSTLFYVTYAEGFKSGGVASPTSGPQREIEPEDLASYEIGAKFSSARARLDASIFYYDYTDLQVQIRDRDTGLNFVQNAADAEIYGAELEGLFAPVANLELGVGVSYLHTKYNEYIGTANVPAYTGEACIAAGGADQNPIPGPCLGYISVARDYRGLQLSNAPEWTAHVRATYMIPLPGGSSLSVNGLVRYEDDYFQVAGGLREPSKTLVNGSLTWMAKDDRLYLSVIGENLTDENYYNYRSESGLAYYGVAGMPRMVSVKLGFNF